VTQLSLAIPASDWCQRWQAGRHSFRHLSEGGFDRRRYDVDVVGEGQAKAFVEGHHYSGSYPAARLRYGLWEHSALVGVAVLSVPVNGDVLTSAFPRLVPYQESIELGRFVLIDQVPANAESWFLARVWELASRQGIRGVVSFSDPLPRYTSAREIVFPGHVGTIYQASNAHYTGRTAGRWMYLLPDGRVLNERSLAKVRAVERGHQHVEDLLCRYGALARLGEEPRLWLRQALATAGVRRVWHPGNHRYLFPIGPRTERRRTAAVLPRFPYPKADGVTDA